ncbi:MAG: transposase [Candidatus Poribacteria bacterium]
MRKNYRYFDLKEGTFIYWWRKEHFSLREIARRVQRSHASISRKLRRNLWSGSHYYPRGAQLIADDRVPSRAKRCRLQSNQVREYVQQKLQLGWTPALISRRLQYQGNLPYVCQELVYQYIYCIAPQLMDYLPRHHHKRKPKRPYWKTGEGSIATIVFDVKKGDSLCVA